LSCLVAEVQLRSERVGEVLHEPDDFVCAPPGGSPLSETGEPLHDREIAFRCVLEAGALHLDDHLSAVMQAGDVGLGDGR
jgi:hypothetical protein